MFTSHDFVYVYICTVVVFFITSMGCTGIG